MTAKRDESMDVQIVCDSEGLPSNDYGGHWFARTITARSLPLRPGDTLDRYIPHAQLVEAERKIAESMAEVERLRSEAARLSGELRFCSRRDRFGYNGGGPC